MATRLWTALLLVAVFAVHGVQCVASGSATDHGSSPLAALSSVGAPAGAVHLTSHLTATAGLPDVAVAGGVHDAAATASTGLPVPWHGAHVLAVGLAVLLAGLTILGAVVRLRARAIPLVRGSPRRGRRFAAWSLRPRPPDLSVLCLLRI